MKINDLLHELGVDLKRHQGRDIAVTTPIDGSKLASLKFDNIKSLDDKIAKSVKAFKAWREVPAPKRGELIRLFGEELRANKETLAQLVTIECGKIAAEGLGEVQEMIDICDFAVGLSRQLYGLTIASERPRHVMQENWLPLGPVAVISAFNFPVAVWAWNFALAVTCGDSVIWKPSEKTPLCALACQALFEKSLKRYVKQGGEAPAHLSQIILGDGKIGERLTDNPAIALVSATGSGRMGKKVGPRVAERFGRTLLELGGNNAIIVSDKADLRLALSSILFGAVGTAGQRCTTTRRVIAHHSIYNKLCAQLEKSYSMIADKIGDPRDKNTLVGPLIDEVAYQHMQKALKQAKAQGGKIIGGKRVKKDKLAEAFYVEPAFVRMKKQGDIVRHETFAPILYVMPYTTLQQALEIHNDVPQGLSSAIFTTDMREAEYFRQNSDCGIANINIGTSGAEIGGAFGGEKETGGGRESGSDAWKNYMRRQTSTAYYGSEKPALAQGIKFDV
ncbi:MAG TPA: aldehyde dehydrogenase family protein [Alphaproteobacteria bacterium]|nr:aldehyde dehydrogenase family protein [Alphaproteobacteria bacterium]